MATASPTESFRDLLLLHRGRTGLTQRELADRVGVNRRSVQEWENGANYPGADRLEALIRVLLEARGLTTGREAGEAQALWAAVVRASPRTHAPFDAEWFTRLLGERAHIPPSEPIRDSSAVVRVGSSQGQPAERRVDWGDAPDTSGFVGRDDQLATLSGWVHEHCRLVALLGMGGIGKTSLAARLAQQVASSFERIYWRSLRDAPLPSHFLAGAIGFLSDQQLVPPASESEQVAALLRLLRERRCLLVLDNFETLLEPGQHQDAYRQGLAGYGQMLKVIATAAHRSCLILTSREAPAELVVLGEVVRTFQLGGLGVEEARALLAPKHLAGGDAEWAELVAYFGGNGLALKVASESIRELFNGAIGGFLEEARISKVFGAIRRLLSEQVERSSVPEQRVLRVLAVEREPIRLQALLAALGRRVGRGNALEAVSGLRRRSLIEPAETPGAPAFTLQSVVLEYVTERLVEAVVDEIARGQPALLVEQPLIQAQTKEYVRQTQERLIGAAIVQALQERHGPEGTQQRLLALLDAWRARPPEQQGYGPGNVINLLRLVRGDLRGLDLSRLAIRQAYLAQVDARGACLVDADLRDSVLAEAFDFPSSVALSRDGTLLAAGTSTGDVHLWQLTDFAPLWSTQGHTGTVFSVVLSTDGQLLASSSGDGTVKLWRASAGQAVATLEGHGGTVWCAAVSPAGNLVASCGADGTARVWETATGRPRATLRGHDGAVRSVALSEGTTGALLASAAEDGTVRLWEPSTGRLLTTLHGHTGPVMVVVLAPDGALLATGGEDGTVRFWDPQTGRLLVAQQAHGGAVWGMALSADGRLAVSGGADGSVRLWDTSTGRPVASLLGNTSAVFDVAADAAGQLVASAGGDGTLRVWDATTARPLTTVHGQSCPLFDVALAANATLVACGGGDGLVRLWDVTTGAPVSELRGHTGTVWGVALSANGQRVASGGEDGTVRLWQPSTGRLVATLSDHEADVLGVALSGDGHLVASAGGDGGVRLWEVGTRQLVRTLRGHAGRAWGVALSADGQRVASCGQDGTLRLWDTTGGQLLAVLDGHTGTVFDVALSADGEVVASSGAGGMVRLWDTTSGQLLTTLRGHTGTVWGVALSADGQRVASCGEDGTLRLWDSRSSQPLAVLRGHVGTVFGVALSADGHLIASGGTDGAVRLCRAADGAQQRSLRPEPRYAYMEITGLTGITAAQRAALLALGAVEQHGPAGEPTAGVWRDPTGS